jgi:hypothetical protein
MNLSASAACLWALRRRGVLGSFCGMAKKQMKSDDSTTEADGRITVSVRLDPELNRVFQDYIDSFKYKPSRQEVMLTLLRAELDKFTDAARGK